jgi:hypothetical protein
MSTLFQRNRLIVFERVMENSVCGGAGKIAENGCSRRPEAYTGGLKYTIL